jgi:predicted RNA-binding protein YlxR (DUF448 family)
MEATATSRPTTPLRVQARADARADGRRVSTRRCIASGELREKSDLLRFVVAPDRAVVLDLAGKLPGRGLWLLPRRDMIDRACGRNLFARAARGPVNVPDDFAQQVVQALRRRCLDLVGLARRGGLVTAGYERVRSKLAAGRAAALVQAVDAAPGGRRKLTALAESATPGLPVVEVFTAGELGRVLGRDVAVHVVLAPGTLTDRFISEVARLSAAAGSEDSETRT